MTIPALINLQTLIDEQKCYETVRHLQLSKRVACCKCGSVQLIACVATQLTPQCAEQLAAVSANDWRCLRFQLEQHRINRVEQLRFRRSPADYLANLESRLL